MRWGNVLVNKVVNNGNGIELTGEYLPDDKDFKSTKKLSWVSKNSPTTDVNLVEYDHLLNVKKVEENMDFETVLNTDTKMITPAVAEPGVKNLKIG
mmetsp:Transcript_35679/g.55530  ORF Transcript_35679/g.55530 Transcript_35679/m.55530 type:complete len:96 (+) Transcript_35679:122-409(+)